MQNFIKPTKKVGELGFGLITLNVELETESVRALGS